MRDAEEKEENANGKIRSKKEECLKGKKFPRLEKREF